MKATTSILVQPNRSAVRIISFLGVATLKIIESYLVYTADNFIILSDATSTIQYRMPSLAPP